MTPSDDGLPDIHTAATGADDSGLVQGKWVILAVIGLAVAASIASWIYYVRLQERPLELWGTRAAELMLRAPGARAFRLAPLAAGAADGGAASGDDGQRNEAPGIAAGRRFAIGGASYAVAAERDVSRAPGFSHVRQGLINDSSFGWDDGPCGEPPQWEFVIEFVDRDATAAVAFDFHCGRAVLAGSERSVSIRPVAAAIEGFLREQFPAEARPPAAK